MSRDPVEPGGGKLLDPIEPDTGGDKLYNIIKKMLLGFSVTSLLLITACGEEQAKTVKPEAEETVKVDTDVSSEEITSTTDSEENTETEEVESNESKGLPELVEHFRSQGFEMGEVTKKAYEMLGAVDGFGVEANGTQIEFYEYDIENATEETKANLDNGRSSGTMSMDGFSFSVVVNGDFILINHDEHPEQDKIVEAFNSFK
ncbi:hypothetical protein V1503_25025, partial [Bacillus sp. SCS-151]|uniref:hypothetical protein n=1 Tax=Nanhaiella sioensis TaxID=3115293 RepID=UPI0039797000